MKPMKRQCAQGELLFRRVERLPDTAREKGRASADAPLIVGHSETGHHHVIRDDGTVLFETSDPLVCYLRAEGPWADVVHLRDWDTHQTARLEGHGALWEIRHQQEWTPEGWKRVED